ncbi:MAG TPA: flagellar FliJ family protein [Burkholderiaceae bacterium]|nr:flagellar FliJ family protein [Burkholderiaceae bacterium]
MKRTPMMQSLTTLIDLREREVERLRIDIAGKAAVRERYLGNLKRMEDLYADGSSCGLPPALSLNRGYYKHAVMQMADAHRTDLALHEADMAVTQRALTTAWCKQEVLGQVLAQKQKMAIAEVGRQERKQQDELAMQMWCREQKS